MIRNVLVVSMLCALPLAAAADEVQMPRMLKGMAKGSWRMETLENSQAKPGQKMPSMTFCTDNLAKDMREAKSSAKSDSKCKHRLIKDGSDEAVWEIACPQRTVTTTMRRESAGSILTDVKTTGDKQPHTMKMRYTSLGPCKAGQQTMSYDKNSPECQKIQAAAAKMDPAKTCASSGDKRAECEKMLREQIAQLKGMCG